MEESNLKQVEIRKVCSIKVNFYLTYFLREKMMSREKFEKSNVIN